MHFDLTNTPVDSSRFRLLLKRPHNEMTCSEDRRGGTVVIMGHPLNLAELALNCVGKYFGKQSFLLLELLSSERVDLEKTRKFGTKSQATLCAWLKLLDYKLEIGSTFSPRLTEVLLRSDRGRGWEFRW